MTYIFPDSLSALRIWLERRHVDVSALKTERQAAFMAQQIARTRFKFPPKGSSCFMLLQQIQGALPATPAAGGAKSSRKTSKSTPDRRASASPRCNRRAENRGGAHGAPTDWNKDLVIFCDGACEPNPGIGGWAFVVYRDGVEVHSEHGGSVAATNNTMEMTAALMALRWFAERGVIEPVRLLCDSQYVVKGCNEWRHGWKRKGWRRGVEKELANADLWRELDEALTLVPIKLEWVKGHVGIVGNERADELSLIGREAALAAEADDCGDLVADQLRYAI